MRAAIARRVAERVARVGESSEALAAAVDRRDESPEALNQWKVAGRRWQAALDALYAGVADDVERMRAGEPRGVEAAIAFLELDPWRFRSGYAKQKLLGMLSYQELTAEQADRLRQVLVHAVDVGYRRTFREHRKLARRVDHPELRRELRARLHAPDEGGRARRAFMLLNVLHRSRLTDEDLARGRLILLREAGRDDKLFIVQRWVEHLAWRHWSPEWEAQLLEAALDGAEPSAALRLLASAPRLQLDAVQHRRLRRSLVNLVERGGDESWFERLAPKLDSPDLRRVLEAYVADGEPEVARRARWALGGMSRAAARAERRERSGL